jgi:hypothetical protein
MKIDRNAVVVKPDITRKNPLHQPAADDTSSNQQWEATRSQQNIPYPDEMKGGRKQSLLEQEWLGGRTPFEAGVQQKSKLKYLFWLNFFLFFPAVTALAYGAHTAAEKGWGRVSFALVMHGTLATAMTVLGVCGSRRFGMDVQRFERTAQSRRARESIGQKFLEVYFYLSFFVLCVGCFSAYSLGREDNILQAACVGFLALLQLFAVYFVIKIVTVYEIVQGFMEAANAIFFVSGLIIATIGALFWKYMATLPSQVPAPDEGVFAASAFACGGVFMTAVAFMGFISSYVESRLLMRVYIVLVGLVIIAFALMEWKLTLFDADAFVTLHCGNLMQFLPEHWVHRWITCDKYYGEAKRWEEAKELYFTYPGVGQYESLNCTTKGDEAFAWEYNAFVDTPHLTPYGDQIDLYGCINLPCCTKLATHMSDVTDAVGMLGMMAIGMLTLGFASALYIQRKLPPSVKGKSKMKILLHHGAKYLLGLMLFALLVGVVAIPLANSELGSPSRVDTEDGVGNTAGSIGISDGTPTTGLPDDEVSTAGNSSAVEGNTSANGGRRFLTALANATQDCTAGEWSAWSLCSAQCGDHGEQVRNRSRYAAPNALGDCEGSRNASTSSNSTALVELRRCNRHLCPWAATAAPTSTPTNTPTAAPTSTPTEDPTSMPTDTPTAAPTSIPTDTPTPIPTATPTATPTAAPTDAPTAIPTASPTAAPTLDRCKNGIQSEVETDIDCGGPGGCPVCNVGENCLVGTDCASRVCNSGTCSMTTAAPTVVPTDAPTDVPTATPTETPTAMPTATPTDAPTATPTEAPTAVPTATPTAMPTAVPTNTPTDAPTAAPTNAPTAAPTVPSVDCVLSEWAEWAPCSQACGTGRETRSRVVSISPSGEHAKACGSLLDVRACTGTNCWGVVNVDQVLPALCKNCNSDGRGPCASASRCWAYEDEAEMSCPLGTTRCIGTDSVADFIDAASIIDFDRAGAAVGCKRYEQAFQFRTDGDVSSCRMQAQFVHNASLIVSSAGCSEDAPAGSCNSTTVSISSTQAKTTWDGPAAVIGAAMESFFLCPKCLRFMGKHDISLTIELSNTSASSTRCELLPSASSESRTATTADFSFNVVVDSSLRVHTRGRVLDGACINRGDCDNSSLSGVSVTAYLPVHDAKPNTTYGADGCPTSPSSSPSSAPSGLAVGHATSDSSGAFTIDIPYFAGLHLSYATLQYTSPASFHPAAEAVQLAASTQSLDSLRYHISRQYSGDDAVCVDRYAGAVVSTQFCTAGCDKLAAEYGADVPEHSYCQCFKDKPVCFGTEGKCVGCWAGTFGPCQQKTSGVCFAVSGDGTCPSGKHYIHCCQPPHLYSSTLLPHSLLQGTERCAGRTCSCNDLYKDVRQVGPVLLMPTVNATNGTSSGKDKDGGSTGVISGVVVAAVSKFVMSATVRVRKGLGAPSSAMVITTVVTDAKGQFSTPTLPAGAYTLTATPVTYTSYDVGVSAASIDVQWGVNHQGALVALPPTVAAGELAFVLQWGGPLVAQGSDPIDLDMYLSFVVKWTKADAECKECYPGSTGTCQSPSNKVCYGYQRKRKCYSGTRKCALDNEKITTTRRCTVFYGRKNCGSAKLMRTDTLPAYNASVASASDAVAKLVASYGIEVIHLKKTFKTSYNLFVRNTRAKVATEETAATVVAYSSAGPTRVQLPSSSIEHERNVYDIAPDRTLKAWKDGTKHGWLKHRKTRKNSEFVRMLCVDGSGSSPVLHQCQRYYKKAGWAYAKNYDRCPPALETCDVGSNSTWRCSDNLVGAAYQCPTGGAASMSFCKDGKFCQNTGFSEESGDAIPSGMCTDGKEAISR